MSKVFYLCDRRKCVRCSYPMCTYTGDIAHAVNFVRGLGGSFFEEPAMELAKVVRCKDCKRRHSSEFCECRPDDAFCSDGELKDGDGNG